MHAKGKIVAQTITQNAPPPSNQALKPLRNKPKARSHFRKSKTHKKPAKNAEYFASHARVFSGHF